MEEPGTRAVFLPKTLAEQNCLPNGKKIVDREKLKEHVTVQSKSNPGVQKYFSERKFEGGSEVDDILELVEKLNLEGGSSCTKNIIDVNSASPSRSSSPARQVSPGLNKVNDGKEQDWCPPVPAMLRDLLPDPLPVVGAVALEIETHVEKKTQMADVKPAIREDEKVGSREAQVSDYADNIVTVKVKKVKEFIVGVSDHVRYSNEVGGINCYKSPSTKQSNLAESYLAAGKEPLKYEQIVKPEKHVKAQTPLMRGKSVGKPGLGCRYKFDPSNPTPDPRWPPGQQVILGPIPEKLAKLYSYSGLCIKLYGPLDVFGNRCHLFLKKTVNERVIGYGYVVYTKETSAKRLLKSKSISLAGCQLQVSTMDRTSQIQVEEVEAVKKAIGEAPGHRMSPKGQGCEGRNVQKPLREASSGFELKVVGGKASLVMKVTNMQAGNIMGTRGRRIRSLEKKFGAKIDIPQEKSKGTRTVTIYGPLDAVEMAQVEVSNILRNG